jgi:hypothetical protein
MAVLSQEGNKLKIVNNGTSYYNLDDVSYSHNGVTLAINVNGYVKESLKYSEITSPSSTSLDNLLSILNGYSTDVSVTVTNATDTTELDLNTRLTHKKLDSLIELQIETNRLLKLILS